MSDLLVLVPDKNYKIGIERLLKRNEHLTIHHINFLVLVHPEHDPGVLKKSTEIVRPYLRGFRYLLVFFDFEGCGQESQNPEDLRIDLLRQLSRNGWENRCEVVIINPELERWVWHPSDETARIIQWASFDELKSWLAQEELWMNDSPKPERPKECFEAALKQKMIPRSSSLYGKIASVLNWQGCLDAEFIRFIETLQRWFPREE